MSGGIIINTDGTPMQDNDSGIDINGNALGDTDDVPDSTTDTFSDTFNDDWSNDDW